jgi:hypothetical protein
MKWAQLPHLAQRNLEESWLSWRRASKEHTLAYFLHGSGLMEYKWNRNQKMKESVLDGLESCLLQKKDRDPVDLFVPRAMFALGEVGLPWNDLSAELKSQFIREVDNVMNLPSSTLASMIFGLVFFLFPSLGLFVFFFNLTFFSKTKIGSVEWVSNGRIYRRQPSNNWNKLSSVPTISITLLCRNSFEDLRG